MTAQDDSLVTLDVTGMTCAACSARVERALQAIDGVTSAAVSLPLERADIHVSGRVPVSHLVEAVEASGYHAVLRGQDTEGRRLARQERERQHGEDRRSTRLLAGLAAAIATPFLIDMVVGVLSGTGHVLVPWLQALLATLCQLACGARFYRGAWFAMRAGAPNMDVLVAIGTSAAYGLSLFHWLADRAHHGGLYFEASVAILAFVLIGKVLEGEAKTGTNAALRALAAATPQRAVRLNGEREEEVRADQLRPGDHVVLRPGSAAPVDGRIVSGAAAFDESLITGESLPVSRAAGDAVVAGSVASGGKVVVEVVTTGDDTRLQRIARLIEDAEISKSPIQQLADRISAVFVPAVMAVAALSGVAWLLWGSSVEHAVLVTVSVLVVACPCALGLATPIALVAGANAAARAGLIVTEYAALEAAGRVSRVAFDKTGTLTLGAPSVVASAATEAGRDTL
ncbi:MAG TPA: HAD-IC family P-type ATPase, partial [Beijerinckiaceae bacterium]|nr:HAD-IC family P-type ATPase [Beijerinckiaceae bacterium]